jgi:hypothetical protein
MSTSSDALIVNKSITNLMLMFISAQVNARDIESSLSTVNKTESATFFRFAFLLF